MAWAIACMSGSFKGVFVHGVLRGLEDRGIRADAYAAASSSTLPAAYASVGRVRETDLSLWNTSETNMSEVVLSSIRALGPSLHGSVFAPGAARLCIATSLVATPEAAALTQTDGARRLGRKLLVDAARQDASWRDEHLAPRLFDSQSSDPDTRLTRDNFDEVAYATTRMLHAWHIPAWVNGQPYVDASYTSLCPALEMAERGYSPVVAIATEPGPLRRDMFSAETIPSEWNGARIVVLQPECDLKELGVDFSKATADGLEQAFALGVHAAYSYPAR